MQQMATKKALEAQLGDMEQRLNEANEHAMRGGRQAMAKLESRVRTLELELGNVQARTSEAMKSHQKSERKIKELAFSNDEDRKAQDNMSELATKLQAKIKTYKKQIEEAEEIAALNLAKYRQTQNNLAGAQERADVNEQALAKAKARSRASSLAPVRYISLNHKFY